MMPQTNSDCNVMNERKHFEDITMRERLPQLYYDCGCCKDCVRLDVHRPSCPLKVET